MSDEIDRQLNENFPGYHQYRFEASIKNKVVGAISFCSPSGEFLSCGFELPVEDARSAGVMKKMLHEVVENILKRGIQMGRKV